jgi:hypothetical protein
MAGTLTRGAVVKGEALVKSVARRIAEDSPKLADLQPEELEKLARVVVAESLKDDLRREADLARIDYRAEHDRFLQRASRTGSRHTLRSYRTALERLEAWCAKEKIAVLELTPALADEFIESEKAAGGSPATVQLRVAAVSSFWTWLERRRAAKPFPRDTLAACQDGAAHTCDPLGCGGEAIGIGGRAKAAISHYHDGPRGTPCRRLARPFDHGGAMELHNEGQGTEREGTRGSQEGDSSGRTSPTLTFHRYLCSSDR